MQAYVPFDWPEKKFSFKYLVARMPRAERAEEADKEADWMFTVNSLGEDNDAGRSDGGESQDRDGMRPG